MKKIISVLLSVLMIASFCTVAFAAEADTAEETMVVLAAPVENEEAGKGEVKALATPAENESTSEETTLEKTTDEAVTDAANQDGVSTTVIVLVVLAVAVVAVAVVVFLKKKGKE